MKRSALPGTRFTGIYLYFSVLKNPFLGVVPPVATAKTVLPFRYLVLVIHP